MKNDIDWKIYNSQIILKVESGELVDSLQVSKKIIPYSTPEYTFTNGSTYDLSYEEKIFLPESVDQTQGQIDISLGSSILTNLLDSIENIASMPSNNFYGTIVSLNKAAALKGIYEKSNRLDEFEKIEVIDYNWNSHLLSKIVFTRINDFSKYQYRDWWMMYNSDCVPRNYRDTCSSFSLTWDFLSMVNLLKKNWYAIDEKIVSKALSYYKNELEKAIKENEQRGYKYRKIDPFFKIIWYDNDFLAKYLLTDRFINTDYKFNNVSKLKIILLLQELSKEPNLIKSLINEVKNKTLIEARWAFVPSDDYWSNNLESTTLALKVFINNNEGEKLLVENLARWILAQKNEEGDFGSSYYTVWVLDIITDYIDYTKELENVSFNAKWYLNYTEVINADFNDKNKFELSEQSYKLSDYIKFGEENSLWFEKKWTGKLYYDVWLRYFLPIEQIESRDEWIIITRDYYKYDDYTSAYKKECINPIWFGDFYGSYWYINYCENKKVKNINPQKSWVKWDLLVWEIEIIVPSERNNVIINNFIPAWAELVNSNLDTTSNEVKNITNQDNSNWRSWFTHSEIKDDKLVLFAEKLYKWSYKYTYIIKLNHSWIYHHRPAVVEELKKPEIFWRTSWEYFEIK